jgi:hypothetical protein
MICRARDASAEDVRVGDRDGGVWLHELPLTAFANKHTGRPCRPFGPVRMDEARATLERQYATSADELRLSRFLADLKHRDAYLRPSIQLKRAWQWDHIVAPGSYDALVIGIRAAVTEVLAMLDERLPPASTSAAAST